MPAAFAGAALVAAPTTLDAPVPAAAAVPPPASCLNDAVPRTVATGAPEIVNAGETVVVAAMTCDPIAAPDCAFAMLARMVLLPEVESVLSVYAHQATINSFACANVPVAGQVRGVETSGVMFVGLASIGGAANGPAKATAQQPKLSDDAVPDAMVTVESVPATVTLE